MSASDSDSMKGTGHTAQVAGPSIRLTASSLGGIPRGGAGVGVAVSRELLMLRTPSYVARNQNISLSIGLGNDQKWKWSSYPGVTTYEM